MKHMYSTRWQAGENPSQWSVSWQRGMMLGGLGGNDGEDGEGRV
jgi:hypothetical protein